MKKIISTLLLAVLFSATTFAGNRNKENNSKSENKVEQVGSNVNLSGTIIDQKNNETLAGATIFIDGKKHYSDLDGNFNLMALNTGKHKISVEMISYNNSQMEIDVQKDTNLKIQLIQE
ncbi:MAG: hypothetical protein H6Q18_1067 [Bacteroidetes bacterium]|nr:hypothetical protein [Bacteroidota bacterium]